MSAVAGAPPIAPGVGTHPPASPPRSPEAPEKQGMSPTKKLVLSLGPETPDCLYSVFLAKLVSLRNALVRLGGELVLCEVAPIAYSVFEACLLNREFTFVADFDAAVAHFAKPT